MKRLTPYIVFILTTLLIGGLGGWATFANIDAYDMLIKPPLTPPDTAFPIVWSALFILMGIGAAIVWEKAPDFRKETLVVYGVQLALNLLWSVIFFAFQAYLVAFAWLIILWIAILVMILYFHKISSLSAYLQIPYLLWVSFAGYLNFMIWMLNR